MKERPIIFGAASVRQILAGTKTQTRRVVKPMPGEQSRWLTQDVINAVPHGEIINGGWQMHHPKAGTFFGGVRVKGVSPLGWIRCPYGAPGNRIWCKEGLALEEFEEGERVVWRSDRAAQELNSVSNIFYLESDYEPARWRSPMLMPRWASRITLDVTEVRVQRLQDITETDILAEGVTVDAVARMTGVPWSDMPDLYSAWRVAWDHINGDRLVGGVPIRWIDNPWVWAITFKRIESAMRAA